MNSPESTLEITCPACGHEVLARDVPAIPVGHWCLCGRCDTFLKHVEPGKFRVLTDDERRALPEDEKASLAQALDLMRRVKRIAAGRSTVPTAEELAQMDDAGLKNTMADVLARGMDLAQRLARLCQGADIDPTPDLAAGLIALAAMVVTTDEKPLEKESFLFFAEAYYAIYLKLAQKEQKEAEQPAEAPASAETQTPEAPANG